MNAKVSTLASLHEDSLPHDSRTLGISFRIIQLGHERPRPHALPAFPPVSQHEGVALPQLFAVAVVDRFILFVGGPFVAAADTSQGSSWTWTAMQMRIDPFLVLLLPV